MPEYYEMQTFCRKQKPYLNLGNPLKYYQVDMAAIQFCCSTDQNPSLNRDKKRKISRRSFNSGHTNILHRLQAYEKSTISHTSCKLLKKQQFLTCLEEPIPEISFRLLIFLQHHPSSLFHGHPPCA